MKKVLVIGLDGARLDVLTKWSEQGYLQTISKILNEGAHGTLKSVLPVHSFPAWTSLSTGVYPPKHGIYNVLLRNKDCYERIPPNSTMVKVKRFWEILDEFNYRCCIVNVPVSYPPKPLKEGVIVSSVLSPSTDHVFAYPKEIWKMLRKHGYKILPTAKPGTERYIEEVHEILDKQYSFVKWYMENHEWDLVFWVIMSTEMLHHHYATFVDPSHPLYKSEYEEIVRDLYIKVDRYIAELMKSLNKNYVLFIVSDHGFAPYYGVVYLNAFLRKHGLLKTRHRFTVLKYYLLLLAKRLGKKVYNYLPKDLKEKAIKVTGFGASEFTLDLIDWSRTKAYVPFLDGHISINLRGREKNGIVKEEEYQPVVKEIINAINKDPELSKLIIAKPKYEVYADGEYLDNAPDIFLLFEEANNKPFKIKTNPFTKKYVDFELTQFKENIGYHTLYGAFLAYGCNIKQKYHRHANIVDIAPTVLTIFKIKPPMYMDGSILSDIFTSSVKPSYDIRDLIKQRLKDIIDRKVMK